MIHTPRMHINQKDGRTLDIKAEIETTRPRVYINPEDGRTLDIQVEIETPTTVLLIKIHPMKEDMMYIDTVRTGPKYIIPTITHKQRTTEPTRMLPSTDSGSTQPCKWCVN
jgi:myo-inositol-1-phosphate synthase